LRTANVELPGDCSFVTYGDSDWASAYRPAISVVTMDLHAVASYVTQLVIDQLHAPGAAPGTMPPPSQFLGRESTGPPPEK
jgi:DNA-binding LacI/PurR family transcriptional regulator